mgnify:CR=1 FL=1
MEVLIIFRKLSLGSADVGCQLKLVAMAPILSVGYAGADPERACGPALFRRLSRGMTGEPADTGAGTLSEALAPGHVVPHEYRRLMPGPNEGRIITQSFRKKLAE